MQVCSLRRTRNYWKIPLYCYHECTSACEANVISNPYSIELSLNESYDRTTGKCNDYNKICSTSIDISAYDLSNPYGDIGRLYNPNVVVIPDSTFTILIDYPLNTPLEVSVNSTNITLRELIYIIQQIYIYIYSEEEKTATPTTFTIQKECTTCINIDLKRVLKDKHNIKSGEGDCSICYNTFNDDAIQLDCNHVFHKHCLDYWIDKGKGESCPLCRKAFSSCTSCNNTKTIETVEQHVVLPMDLRPDEDGLRNTTNGLFGIHSYDIDTLHISQLWYNKNHKLLQVFVHHSY